MRVTSGHRTGECSYREDLFLLIMGDWIPARDGKVYDFTVQHDPWCVYLGGNGIRPCHPEFSMQEATS